jgi:hypothetical protein
MTYRIEVFPEHDTDDTKAWRVRIVHANGNKLHVSQPYNRHWNARRAGRKVAQVFGLEYREVTQ